MRNEKKNRLLIESVRYITGNQKNLKVKGPTPFVNAYKEAIKASRNLYEALHNDKSSLKDIETLVEIRNKAGIKFQKITGTRWPF